MYIQSCTSMLGTKNEWMIEDMEEERACTCTSPQGGKV